MDRGESKASSWLKPDFDIKDTDGQSVLSLCLWAGLVTHANKLIGNRSSSYIIISKQNIFIVK